MHRIYCIECAKEITSTGMRCLECLPRQSAITNTCRNDAVRQKAYEEAMRKIRDRPGLWETLSEEQWKEILAWDGPEGCGTWPTK